jgi:hypothetical protein
MKTRTKKITKLSRATSHAVNRLAIASTLCFSIQLASHSQAITPTRVITPALALSANQQHTYQFKASSTVSQTVNGKAYDFSPSYTAVVTFTVGKQSPDSALAVTASFSDPVNTFQFNGRDTVVSASGSTGSYKSYSYSTRGKLLHRGPLQNNPSGKTLDLENDLEPCRAYCELPEGGISEETRWVTSETDTIFSPGLGGTVTVTWHTTFTGSTSSKISGKAYAVISYSSTLSVRGSNDLYGDLITVTGEGTRTGKMLVDAIDGLLYSDQNTLAVTFNKEVTGKTTASSPVTRQTTCSIQRTK